MDEYELDRVVRRWMWGCVVGLLLVIAIIVVGTCVVRTGSGESPTAEPTKVCRYSCEGITPAPMTVVPTEQAVKDALTPIGKDK